MSDEVEGVFRGTGLPHRGPAALPTVVIEASRAWRSVDWGELWSSRELVLFLVWRDLKVRYRQTVLGVLWVVVQPLATMAVFSIFLGKLAKMPSNGLPYPVFVLAGLVPWGFFSHALGAASLSLLRDQELVKKVYFCRLSIPLAAVLSCLVDFGPSLILLLGLMAIYGLWPAIQILWLPAFCLIAFATALGPGLALAATSVKYRDVTYVVPFWIQTWMFLTPVVYPSSLLPGGWRLLYSLNPMVGVVDGARWCLLGTGVYWPGVAISIACAIALVTGGLTYFRQRERTFADLI